MGGDTEDLASLSREELVEHAVALRTVVQVADAVHQARHLEDFLERAVDAITRFTAYPSVGIFRVEAARRRAVRVAIRGFGPEVEAASREFDLDASLTGAAVRTGQVVTSADLARDQRVDVGAQHALTSEQFSGVASVPMLFHGEVLGTINLLYRGAHDLTRQERRTLLSVGQTIASALRVHEAEDARREAEKLAQRQQRLEGLGALAGGLAHDFNNLLVGVLGSLGLAREELAAGLVSEVDARIGDAEEASLRAQRLARQLLTFSRGGDPVLAPTPDVARVVVDAAQLAARGAGVALRVRAPEVIGPALADPAQLSQVVQSLVLNAVQASAPGGHVRVDVAREPLPDGSALVVAVADDGPGMSPEVLARIYEPFFTTKPLGSGLGLAIAHSIVKRLGGRIEVESAPAAGSRFTVTLPLRPCEPSPRPPTAPDVRGLRVLVVDDDEGVRGVALRMVKKVGATAEGAEDGAQASKLLRAAQEQGRPYGVALVDMNLREGAQGVDVGRALREIDPALCLVATSGYTETGAMADPAAHGFVAALAKPYAMADLRRVLEAAIAAPPVGP